jgi:hypothetical protein
MGRMINVFPKKKGLIFWFLLKSPPNFCPKNYLIFSWGCGLWGKKTIRKNFNNQGVISSRFVCLGGERVLILGEH